MRRRTCDHPIQVKILGDSPAGFRQGDRDYEVITFLKMLALGENLAAAEFSRFAGHSVSNSRQFFTNSAVEKELPDGFRSY